MSKTRSNETQTPETASPLPELSLEELSAVRGGRCRRCGPGRHAN